MIPKTVVEHDTSGLEMVIDAMEKLDEERFIEGIRCRHRDTYEIKQMTEMVEIYQRRVNIEARSLSKFSENFIRQFATDNNKCFNTAEKLFSKLKSTIAGLKKIFSKMTKTERRQLPQGVDTPSVFDKSALSTKEFMPDLYGLDSYPESVSKLYYAIDTIFSTSTVMLALCHEMIEKEEETRKDVVQLRQIYKESCEELLRAVKAVSAFVVTTGELPENELEELRKKAGSEDNEGFLQKGYHSYSKDVLTKYLVIRTIKKARNEGLTDQEAFFWRKDTKKALLVRKVIENFDSVEEVEGNGGKISPRAVVEFLKWCGVNESLEKKLYLNYFMPRYNVKGKHKPIGWTTVSAMRKDLKDDCIPNAKLARQFTDRLSNILSPEEIAA